MSSLAAQLAQSASLNAAILVDRSRRKAGESYLFTGREADQHDLESIHALGVNGLAQLAFLCPSLRAFEDPLFSDQAKATDRTLLSIEASTQLDKTIATFLCLLGPYLLENPTGKILEWLVRRFRVNEFNIEAILTVFLPYHESPHFAKMVTILHIKQNSTWSFLLPYKSAGQSVPRVALVTEMLRNTDVARFVTSLLPSALKDMRSHRALLAFNAATLHALVTRSKSLNEGTLAYLLPALLEPLQRNTQKDAILGSYILLSSMSQKCQLAPSALRTTVGAMASTAHNVTTSQFLSAAVAVCEPQALLDTFSESAVKAILRLPDIQQELSKTSTRVGVDKIICPLLAVIGQRLKRDNTVSLLDAILSAPSIPAVVVQRTAIILVNSAISSEASALVATSARRLLTVIQQRYPTILEEAVGEVCQQNEALRESAEQLIISLSITKIAQGSTPGKLAGQGNVDMVVASTSAEAKVRVIAVNDLIKSLSDQTAAPSDLEFIHSALLARVQDTNINVLDALYDRPSVILPILLKDSQAYVNYLSHALSAPGSKPKRNILRIHLTFLATHFCPCVDSTVLEEVFYRLFFPFLLYSKPRQHTADAVWDIITQHQGLKSSIWTFELLSGCGATVRAEKEKAVESAERMNDINMAIASSFAKNILISNSYPVHFDALVTNLQDSNSHVRALSYLIVRALLGHLSGGQQLDAAHKILKAMALDRLSGIEDLSAEVTLAAALSDTTLGQHVIGKPSGKSTLHWLQISLITSVASIPAPIGSVLNWFSDADSYVRLMRILYQLINNSTSLPNLTTSLLGELFSKAQDESLAFLAGIWSGPSLGVDEDDQLRTVALHHAAAFLEAYVARDEGIDFQTIVPALLVALQSSEAHRRKAALGCFVPLLQLAEKRFTTVYKFDIIYGQSERKLQYLDQEDLKKYVTAIVDHQDHLAHDSTYLKIFHQQHLLRTQSNKKRDSDYKHRLLCYLISHINTLSLPIAQVALLKSVEAVSDKAKATNLLPTMQVLVAADVTGLAEVYGPHLEEFASLILSSFDASVASDLNGSQSALWDTFVSALRLYLTLVSSQRLAPVRALEHGLFTSLRLERKIAVCNLLLDISTQDTETYTYCKKLLAHIIQEVPLIVHLLNALQPAQSAAGPRASKRAKISDVDDNVLPRLSLLAEVLGTKALPGSLDLITHLLETLNKVVQSASPTQVDVSYIEQLLMSAVENAAEKIVEMPNLSPGAIRLDILVELIRVADNPQTFHQALLLMATLARLAPDSVLRNVMPVFTFMGSNVFHRDDTYSFRVVQQTIDSIVPVMVSSLKGTHTQQLDLYIGSKEFLRVFTDAANHIPRHRRTNFFAHLVNVLGPGDFLAPVSMLLIEKVANRVVRQNVEEAQNSLVLPTSLLQNYPPALQTSILTELLSESQRLAARIISPDNTQPTFLEGSLDGEHSMPLSAVLRRRAHALIIFVGSALKPSAHVQAPASSTEPPGGRAISNLVSALIALATLQGGPNTENGMDDISQAARASLNQALGVMSAVDFISAVLSMVESGDQVVQRGALDLLSDRLANVSDEIRQEITPTVNKIVDSIHKLVTLQPEGSLSLSAFLALRSIGLTMCPGEENAITNTIPLIIKAIKGRTMAHCALTALSPLSIKIGPRIIPYFREIVTQSVTILREEGHESTANVTFNVLNGLLLSIPTFWGTGELTQVIALYIDKTSIAPSAPMTSLMKAIAKRAPTKVLLPTIIEMWSSLRTSPKMDRVICYLDLLTRALRSAVRPAVLEQLRPLFNVLLQSLDVVKTPAPRSRDAESQAILAFKELVVKLNEAAFRPLFRRLYDWAFANDTADTRRKVTFCYVYIGLLDFFKGLMNPYMTFLLQPFVESLKAFSSPTDDDPALWACIVETLTKSLSFDDGAFWRDDKLRQIAAPLIAQVTVCVRQNSADNKPLLQQCLGALTDSVTDDMLLKSINLDLLMHTRSEDARLRLFALSCSETLWRTHGGKLLGFAAETTTFIAECSEDENDMVVRESIKLKNAVESVAGNINGL